MHKRYIHDDYINKYFKEVDNLYFNGCSLSASIENASNVLHPREKSKVIKWLDHNFNKSN